MNSYTVIILQCKEIPFLFNGGHAFMKLTTMILVTLIGVVHYTCSAQSILTGRLQDTILRRNCVSAIIALLRNDSSMIQFTRSHKDGRFSLKGIDAGKYQLLITHPLYAPAALKVEVPNHSTIDLGIIALLPKAQELAAVTVTPREIPTRLHGDTIEFNTAHLKMRANATVEELLTRLPGVQVDQNGVITVNGKKIDRLLVDGEDIFSKDPAIITRNFNAELIAKVQVLDKKSRQSEFTGIDDGRRSKTLNLTLKEEEKRGYFLKAEVGDGAQGYHNINGLIGSFKDRRQLTALSMKVNTGISGFSGSVGDMGSDLNIGNDVGDPLGASAGGGIPQTTGLGIHYSDRWNAAGDHAAGNYAYGEVVAQPYAATITRQVLTDSVYINYQKMSSINRSRQHALAGDCDYAPDSVSAFHFSLGGGDAAGQNKLISSSSSSFNDALVNSSLRTIRSEVKNRSISGGVMWRRQGRKEKGRIFALIARMSAYDNNANGFLYALNNYYHNNGALPGADTVDQRKEISGNGFSMTGNISYTEPFWKNFILGLSYGVTYDRSRSLFATYNKGDGKYEDHIDSLSNHYQSNVITQHVAINVQRQYKKLDYAIGGNVGYYSNRQLDLLNKPGLNYQYFTIGPHMNIGCNFDSYSNFKFSYGVNTEQPSPQQLQPIQNNNDPLHITLGNSSLHTGFSHNFTIAYNNVKSFIKYLNLTYRLTTNVISNRTMTDSLGRQISQAVNVGESQNLNYYAGFSQKIKSIDLNVGVSNDFYYSRNQNYVNQYLNKNDNYFAGGGVNLDKFVADKYKFILSFTLNYAYLRSSINPSGTTHYWTQSHNTQLSIYPLPGWEVGANANYFWRQRLGSLDKHTSILVWNAFINKDFFKNHLVIKWQINDLLNRNIGSSRIISTNQVIESTFNTIGRYWMISASWRFKHQRKNVQ